MSYAGRSTLRGKEVTSVVRSVAAPGTQCDPVHKPQSVRVAALAVKAAEYVVLCRKLTTGAVVVFSRYETRRAAELVAEQLRNVAVSRDLDCARAADVAGLSRR